MRYFFVINCSASFLSLVPREICDSYLWNYQCYFTLFFILDICELYMRRDRRPSGSFSLFCNLVMSSETTRSIGRNLPGTFPSNSSCVVIKMVAIHSTK